MCKKEASSSLTSTSQHFSSPNWLLRKLFLLARHEQTAATFSIFASEVTLQQWPKSRTKLDSRMTMSWIWRKKPPTRES